MATLEEDTLYYRWDHPNGFLFSAGNEEPAAEDGWSATQEDISDGPEVAYECTTLAAFQALLNSERSGAAAALANYQATIAQANAAVSAQQMIIEDLQAQLDALASPGEQP